MYVSIAIHLLYKGRMLRKILDIFVDWFLSFCFFLLSLSSRTFARTARSTRTNRNGKSRRSGSSSWLRPSTSWAANWKYVAAHRYTTFIGRARKWAPRRIGHGSYTTNRPRLSSASTTCNHRRIFRPVRRNPTGKLGWKVKASSLLLAFFWVDPVLLLQTNTFSRFIYRNSRQLKNLNALFFRAWTTS